jgi:hypothetical protein
MSAVNIKFKYKGKEYDTHLQGAAKIVGMSKSQFKVLYWQKKKEGATDQECVDYIVNPRPKKEKTGRPHNGAPLAAHEKHYNATIRPFVEDFIRGRAANV